MIQHINSDDATRRSNATFCRGAVSRRTIAARSVSTDFQKYLSYFMRISGGVFVRALRLARTWNSMGKAKPDP
jgi:hypothetical protein